MLHFLFLVFLVLPNGKCDDKKDDTVLISKPPNITLTTVKPIANVQLESKPMPETRKSLPLVMPKKEVPPKVLEKAFIETRKENIEDEKIENELEGVVLALSMKKPNSGVPKWYSQIKNGAKNLFNGFSHRRFKQIRFRGQDPSVTVDLKAEAIVPALKEILASKQIQKVLNSLASKAAIVYRAFQDDYVKDKKKSK